MQGLSAWSVKTRCAPSRHCRDARVYGHTTMAIHETSTPRAPPSLLLRFTAASNARGSIDHHTRPVRPKACMNAPPSPVESASQLLKLQTRGGNSRTHLGSAPTPAVPAHPRQSPFAATPKKSTGGGGESMSAAITCKKETPGGRPVEERSRPSTAVSAPPVAKDRRA